MDGPDCWPRAHGGQGEQLWRADLWKEFVWPSKASDYIMEWIFNTYNDLLVNEDNNAKGRTLWHSEEPGVWNSTCSNWSKWELRWNSFVQFVQFLSLFVRLFVCSFNLCRLQDSLQQKIACWELERVVRVSAWNDWSAFKCTLPRLLQPRISFDANSMQNGSPLLKQMLGCRSCFSCLTQTWHKPCFPILSSINAHEARLT